MASIEQQIGKVLSAREMQAQRHAAKEHELQAAKADLETMQDMMNKATFDHLNKR